MWIKVETDQKGLIQIGSKRTWIKMETDQTGVNRSVLRQRQSFRLWFIPIPLRKGSTGSRKAERKVRGKADTSFALLNQ